MQHRNQTYGSLCLGLGFFTLAMLAHPHAALGKGGNKNQGSTTAPAPAAAVPATAANVSQVVYQMMVGSNPLGGSITLSQMAPDSQGRKQWQGGQILYREVSRDVAANTVQLVAESLGGYTVTIDLTAKKLTFSHKPRTRYDLISASAPPPTAPVRIGRNGRPLAVVTPTPAVEPVGTPEQKLARVRLGCGYDATGEYALPTGIRAPIFDLSNDASFRIVGRLTDSGTQLLDITTGSSASQFSDKLSVKAGVSGSVGLFSGSVKAGVNTSSNRQSNTAFAQVDDRWVYFTASLERSATPTQQALRELNNMPVHTLVAKYGTHYTNSLQFGGHITYTTSKSYQRDTEVTDFQVDVEAKYASFKANGSVSGSSSSTTSASNSLSNFRITGGTAGANALLPSYWDEPKYYREWAASIPNKAEIAGFGTSSSSRRGSAQTGGSTGLIGIWNVPGVTAERAQEIQDYVNGYVTRSHGTLFNTPLRQVGTPLKKNDTLVLKTVQDGTFLTLGEINSLDRYHYARVGPREQAQRHTLDGGAESLASGNIVKIKTLHTSAPNGSYLRVPSTANDCYYSNVTSSVGTWRVWLGSTRGLRTGTAIYPGDAVVIESVEYEGRYLAPDSNGYLEVKADTPSQWTFALAPFKGDLRNSAPTTPTRRGAGAGNRRRQ